ncbi:DinB family protein [Streptomyces phytohabitans]|uniref:DinB family protein n=1 Tax=Streptomyces phytohabitans TaxID=1150371 RepID=UPI00345B55F9
MRTDPTTGPTRGPATGPTARRITDGPERAVVEDLLDHNRAALAATVRGLSEADARRRLVPSLTTPISLLKHAAAAERIWFQRLWAGLDAADCDGYAERDEGTFAVADDESLADVVAEFERAGARSRAIAARFRLDDTRHDPREGTVSMRWTLLAMAEEFARHAGHGDILREQLLAAGGRRTDGERADADGVPPTGQSR